MKILDFLRNACVEVVQQHTWFNIRHLTALYALDAEDLQVKDVGRIVTWSSAGATEGLQKLRAHGLVADYPDPVVRKATWYRLTPAGRQLLRDIDGGKVL